MSTFKKKFLFLRITKIDSDFVTGADVATGTVTKMSLATRDEIRNYISNSETMNLDIVTNLNNRLSINMSGRLSIGSIVKYTNVYEIPNSEGSTKMAALWHESVVLNPQQESMIRGETEPVVSAHVRAIAFSDARPLLNVLDHDNARLATEFNFEHAFNGVFQGVNVASTGVIIGFFGSDEEFKISKLQTPDRRVCTPTLDSALSSTHTKQTFLAAVVTSAYTDRSFSNLTRDGINEHEYDFAFSLHKSIVNGVNDIAITVIPSANITLLPKNATIDFLKAYHGTTDGEPNTDTMPDPSVSYKGKGYVPSIISLSAHPSDPTRVSEVKKIFPENIDTFTTQPLCTLSQTVHKSYDFNTLSGAAANMDQGDATLKENIRPTRLKKHGFAHIG